MSSISNPLSLLAPLSKGGSREAGGGYSFAKPYPPGPHKLGPPPFRQGGLSSQGTVFIRRGAGALGGDHAGSHRVLRRAGRSEKRAALGTDAPGDHIAAAAGRGLWRGKLRQTEAPLGVQVPQLFPKPQAALFDAAKATPQVGPGFKGPLQHPLGKQVPVFCHGTLVFVLHPGLSLPDLLYEAVDREQDILRLEAGDDGGHAVFLRQEAKALFPDDGGHMARAEKALHRKALHGHQGPQRRLHQLQHGPDGKVFDALLLCREGRRGGAGGGGLKAHAQEDHFLFRMGLGDLDGVHGGIDDLHPGAQGTAAQETVPRFASGDPQHVAVACEDHPRLHGQVQDLVDDLRRGDADRAARPA